MSLVARKRQGSKPVPAVITDNLNQCYHYGQDWVTKYLHKQRIEYLSQVISNYVNGDTVALDVGCGSGVYSVLLGLEKAVTVGIDLSDEGISNARAWATEAGVRQYVNLIKCSAEFLPFTNSAFNFLLSSELVEHLDYPEMGLSEMKRVLAGNSLALLTLPNLISCYWIRFRISYDILKIIRRKIDILAEKHTQFPIWRTLRIMKKNNLVPIDISSTNIFPLPFSIMKNLLTRYPKNQSQINYVETRLAQTMPFKRLGSSIVILAKSTSQTGRTIPN